MRSLVLFAYTERPAAVENLTYFQTHGMAVVEEVDYVLIVNGEVCSVELSPRWHSVLRRSNNGLDFGAWRLALGQFSVDNYDYLFCLNDTVRGPYHNVEWLGCFARLLTEETLLAGITINISSLPDVLTPLRENFAPHVQSMFWCTNKKGWRFLLPLLLQPEPVDKLELIILKEVGMSLSLLRAGYNITCILPAYQHDYRLKDRWNEYAIRNYSAYSRTYGETWFIGSYFGRTLHPSDVIFFKTNRGMVAEG